jgi:peroxin-14/E3 ubiquitin-protein ligase SIS3
VSQQHPRFTWYRAFVAAGLLLGFGASAAVFIKVSSASSPLYMY